MGVGEVIRLGTIASWFVHLYNGPDAECYWCYRRAVKQLRRQP